jgi:lysozyme
MIPGLDAGVPQGAISVASWRIIRTQGRRWTYLRCMEGTAIYDPTFAANTTGAVQAGIARGAYFVLHPWLDAEQQVAVWFAACSRMGRSVGELPPTVDVELDHTKSTLLTPAQIRTCLVATVQAMARLWGRSPTIYTYPDFWARDILAGASPEELGVLGSCLLWYAAYRTTPPAPPAPWKTITFWQDSGGSAYRTPEGAPCDDDQFLGDEAAFEALASWFAPLPNPLAGIPPAGLVIPGENEET